MRPLADIKRDLATPYSALYIESVENRLLDDIPALVARVEALTQERDDAQGILASLTDAVNTWCREVGCDTKQARQPTRSDIVTALDAIGVHANEWRIRRDALEAALREIRDCPDYPDSGARLEALWAVKARARKALDGEK